MVHRKKFDKLSHKFGDPSWNLPEDNKSMRRPVKLSLINLLL